MVSIAMLDREQLSLIPYSILVINGMRGNFILLMNSKLCRWMDRLIIITSNTRKLKAIDTSDSSKKNKRGEVNHRSVLL